MEWQTNKCGVNVGGLFCAVWFCKAALKHTAAKDFVEFKMVCDGNVAVPSSAINDTLRAVNSGYANVNASMASVEAQKVQDTAAVAKLRAAVNKLGDAIGTARGPRARVRGAQTRAHGIDTHTHTHTYIYNTHVGTLTRTHTMAKLAGGRVVSLTSLLPAHSRLSGARRVRGVGSAGGRLRDAVPRHLHAHGGASQHVCQPAVQRLFRPRVAGFRAHARLGICHGLGETPRARRPPLPPATCPCTLAPCPDARRRAALVARLLVRTRHN